jgi:hypothetical protein
MMVKTKYLKLKLFLIVVFLFLVVTIISNGCICPLFSLIEKLTGLEVRTGNNIDQDIVAEELVYPDSTVLLQTEGNINRILELAGRYGAVLSEKDLSVLDELPQGLREQEVSATIYSTADNKIEVLDYYNSFDKRIWDIQEMQNEEQIDNGEKPTMLFASRENEQQAFMLIGTQNNTFIVFIDFDWEVLSEIEK